MKPKLSDSIIFDDDAKQIASLAKKATRKAARRAKAQGYSFVQEGGDCVITPPSGKTVRIHVKNTAIDVKKRYTFARSAH